MTDRNQNLEEFVVSATNASDNKIALIEVDGIISGGEIETRVTPFSGLGIRQDHCRRFFGDHQSRGIGVA